MTAGEGSIIDGTGSQTGGGSRWGDYSSLSVDPVDDDTFWAVHEYVPVTSASGWRLRVGSFRLSTVPLSNLLAAGSAIISAGTNNTIDPGETVTVTLGIRNVNVGAPGTVCTSSALTGTLQSGGGVTAPSGAQNYGAMCTEGPVIYRQFTFTVDPSVACGSTITASMALVDGPTNFGTVTYQFVTGSVGPTTIIPVENFDSVAAPALPPGWVAAGSGASVAPVTVTTFPDTAPNSAFFSETATVGLSELTSPSFSIPSPGYTLNFRLEHNTEATFDGMVLEISIADGAFQDIIAAGGSFVTGGYTGPLSTGFSNPLPGRQAWSGLSGGTAAAPLYKDVVVNMPPASVGQNVRFKWRLGADSSTVPGTNPGARVDTIRLSSTALVCSGNSAPSGSAVSRQTHGAAGSFDIPLNNAPLTGAITVEPRSAVPGEYQILVTFPNPVTVGGVKVNAGTGAATFTVASNVVTINLTGVTDRQRLGLTLTSVSDGANLGSVLIPVGILIGDVGVNGNVSSSDVGQVKSAVGATVTNLNFRNDPATNGAITTSDVGLVKSKTGNTLP
jgi:hypothetical protein